MAIAQRLFHARGYDAVSVADLTDALGINPPSFYAAFGSKAALYARSLGRYTETQGVPLSAILSPGRPVAEALSAVLEHAARSYATCSDAPGCLAIEGARCNDLEAREAALALTAAAHETIRRFVTATDPDMAERLADYVVTVMTGLSAMARQGYGLDRLLASAALAGAALDDAARDRPAAAAARDADAQ